MSIKEIIKKLLFEVNPLAQLRRSKMRKRLTNTTPSFLCPNCIGGILFHDLGLKFQSPTVNLMMYQTDFVKFVRDMEHYLSQELVFYRHEEYTFPCAHLDDLTLYFTHYASEQEAAEKWRQRKERIDWDNLFIFLEERDGLTEADIRSLKDIRARALWCLPQTHIRTFPIRSPSQSTRRREKSATFCGNPMLTPAANMKRILIS